MNTRITSDIFGRKWPAIQAQEAELRKKKAEKKAEKGKKRRAQQAAAKAAANKNQFFCGKRQEDKNQRKDPGPDSSSSSSNDLPNRSQPPPPRKQGPRQDNKKDKDRNKGGGRGHREWQSTPSFQVSPGGGGETICLQPTLGTGDLRQVGAPDDVFRLPFTVHQPPSKTFQGHLHTAPQRQGQAQGTTARIQPAPSQESDRESNPGADSSPLSLPFYHKEAGRLATYPQPQETQQIHQATSVQDGVASSRSPRTTTQLVGSQPGSEGRLPPRSHLSFLQKMSGFRHQRWDLPLQVPPVRPLYSPPHIHQGGQGHSRTPQEKGVYVFIYLDDWLLTAPSPEILRDQVRMIANLVQRLGFIVNFQKSTLQPSQKVQFLGFQLDFTRGMVFPTEDRVQSVI